MRKDPPLNAQEALLDVVNEWADSLTHLQRAQLQEAIVRITDQRPGWPFQQIFEQVEAEARN